MKDLEKIKQEVKATKDKINDTEERLRQLKNQKRTEVIKMADSFHFEVSITSRGKGKSTKCNIYKWRKIKNKYCELTHDYTRS